MKKLFLSMVAGLALAGCGGMDDEKATEEAAQVQGEVSTAECQSLWMGSATSCKDAATWKQYAYNDCASRGLQLVDYSLAEPCSSTGYRYVKYVCC